MAIRQRYTKTAQAVLLSLCMLSPAMATELNIAAGELQQALLDLANQARVQIAFEPNVQLTRPVTALKGELSATEALAVLLQDSSLEAVSVAPGSFLIRPVVGKAQNSGNTPAAAEKDPKQNSASAITEVIKITGSRIGRHAETAPIPTTVLDASYIDSNGVTSIADMMTELPAISVGLNGQNNNLNMGNAGLNLLDLRGLGYTRTLILVNGRRHVGSQAGNTAVDISTISPALIERVETITGGASSVYGADAVSGVVNFILKKDFEGLQLDGQLGGSEAGGARDQSFSLTAGSVNASGGNLTVHLNYAANSGLLARQRDFAKKSITYQDVNKDGFFEFYDDSVIRITGPAGITLGAVPQGITAWDTSGNFVDPTGSPVFGFSAQQGGLGLRTPDYAQIRPATERLLFNTLFNQPLNANTSAFFEGKYALTKANIQGQPAYFGSFGNFARPATLSVDNPYLHPDAAAYLRANKVSSFRVEKASEELGLIDFRNSRHLLQLVTGLEGSVAEQWRWSSSVQLGRSEGEENGLDRDEARAQQAIDVILNTEGKIVCRDPANACVPMNLFGRQQATPELINFLMFREIDKNELSQRVFNASITGDLLELPAGTLAVAAGVEYRQERSAFNPSLAHQLGRTYRTNAGALKASQGRYQVKETYAELLLPVLADMPYAERLDIDAAYRLSDYSTAGTNDAWKLGLDWQLSPDLRFRFSQSKSVRAPNIAELFQSAQPGFAFVEDPCDVSNRALGAVPATRAANCSSLGMGPEFLSDAERSVRTLFTSGNLALQPEVSDTLTAGLVLTPQWLDGLSLTWDHWQISISDAIQTFSANSILANCVDFSSVDNQFCQLVQRDPSGQINHIRVQQINIAEFKASGWDLDLAYQFQPTRYGQFRLNLIATRLNEKDYYQTPGGNDVARQTGNTENPKWQGLLRLSYQLNALELNAQLRYVGDTAFDPLEATPRPDRLVPSYSQTNLQARYQFSEQLELYSGVTNLWDRQPPKRVNLAAGQGIAGSFYDAVGRSFYLGSRYRF